MKDKNGIEVCCENCKYYGTYLFAPCMICGIKHTRGFKPTVESYEARIAELQAENALLKDGESHIMDVKMSPKFVKSIIRVANSEVEILKREPRFTDDELNLIRIAFQDQIREDKDGWSAEKKIIAKCDEILKERKD